MQSDPLARANVAHLAGATLDRIPPDAIVCIAKVRNEAWRLPFWLAYHRWLGVDHFVIIDNRSTDETVALLTAQSDVTLLDAPGRFNGPVGFNAWIGAVLAASPQSRWNLILDADELFVAVPWQANGLSKTVSALENEDTDVAFALMIDCYPETSSNGTSPQSAVPWLRAPWFDTGPYAKWNVKRGKPKILTAGVRERVFWPDWYWKRKIPTKIRRKFSFSAPPSLEKAPLFRASAARGPYIHAPNNPVARRSSYVFGLLHYPFDVNFFQKIEMATSEGQYSGNSSVYRRYQSILQKGDLTFRSEKSKQFTGFNSIVGAGLCPYRNFGDRLGAIAERLDPSIELDCGLEDAWRQIRAFGGSDLPETVSIPAAV